MPKILYKNPAVSQHSLTEEDFAGYVKYATERWGDKCPDCNGFGRVYDPKDRDVIEGYKLASRTLFCTSCSGSGKLERYLESEFALIDATLWAEAQKRERDALEFKKSVRSQLDRLKQEFAGDFKELIEFVEQRLS